MRRRDARIGRRKRARRGTLCQVEHMFARYVTHVMKWIIRVHNWAKCRNVVGCLFPEGFLRIGENGKRSRAANREVWAVLIDLRSLGGFERFERIWQVC